MSTNFYIRETSIDTESGRVVQEDTHIGKRSGGWTFMFQGIETRSVEDWRLRLATLPSNMVIVDEYDTPYAADEFWALVDQTTKPWGPGKIEPKTQRSKTGRTVWINEGFSFAACEFC